MNIDLTFVNNEWLRGVLADSVCQKVLALTKWSKDKELELQSQIHDMLEDGTHPSEVSEMQLEKLCNQYERQQQTTAEFEHVSAELHKQLGIKPKVYTGNSLARAKALIKRPSN